LYLWTQVNRLIAQVYTWEESPNTVVQHNG